MARWFSRKIDRQKLTGVWKYDLNGVMLQAMG